MHYFVDIKKKTTNKYSEMLSGEIAPKYLLIREDSSASGFS